MKNLLFDNWNQWWVCFCAGCKKALWGIWRIVTCIIFGIISLIVFAGKQIEAFCKRETIAAFIIAVVIIGLSAGWITTFMKYRVSMKSAEYQRDSIGYTLDKYLQAYDSTSMIIVDNDTIRKASSIE